MAKIPEGTPKDQLPIYTINNLADMLMLLNVLGIDCRKVMSHHAVVDAGFRLSRLLSERRHTPAPSITYPIENQQFTLPSDQLPDEKAGT